MAFGPGGRGGECVIVFACGVLCERLVGDGCGVVGGGDGDGRGGGIGEGVCREGVVFVEGDFKL